MKSAFSIISNIIGHKMKSVLFSCEEHSNNLVKEQQNLQNLEIVIDHLVEEMWSI